MSEAKRHIISLLVDNEPSVLARVVGLLSARGVNIETLTVSETEQRDQVSRITLITYGILPVIKQIMAQLERLIPIRLVIDLTSVGPCVERDLALIKLVGVGEQRAEALRLADAFRARIVDATPRSLVLEITGTAKKIGSFIALMRPLGVVDVTRTGVTAINRGDQSLAELMAQPKQ